MKTELIPLEGDTPEHAFTLRVVRFGQAGAGPDIYMQAGLHANELPGMLALDRLIPMLDAAEREGRLEGRVRLVPNANPVGLAQSLFDRAFGVHELNSGMTLVVRQEIPPRPEVRHRAESRGKSSEPADRLDDSTGELQVSPGDLRPPAVDHGCKRRVGASG